MEFIAIVVGPLMVLLGVIGALGVLTYYVLRLLSALALIVGDLIKNRRGKAAAERWRVYLGVVLHIAAMVQGCLTANVAEILLTVLSGAIFLCQDYRLLSRSIKEVLEAAPYCARA